MGLFSGKQRPTKNPVRTTRTTERSSRPTPAHQSDNVLDRTGADGSADQPIGAETDAVSLSHGGPVPLTDCQRAGDEPSHPRLPEFLVAEQPSPRRLLSRLARHLSGGGPVRGGGRGGWVVFTEDGPVSGPAGLDPKLRERLAAGEGVPFRMGETVRVHRGGRRSLVYDTGLYLGPPADRFAPLIEHGFPWSGALWIEYAEGGGWSRPAGLWLRPAWWRTLRRHRGYRTTRLYPAPALSSGRRA